MIHLRGMPFFLKVTALHSGIPEWHRVCQVC